MEAYQFESGYLAHYGVGHDKGGNSGRYPWGSGDSPYQHSIDFLTRVRELRKAGIPEKEIAAVLCADTNRTDISTAKLRDYVNIARYEERNAQVARAKELRDSGMSLQAIAKEMGI